MVINWFGLTAFRIQENGISLLLNPPEENSGIKLPRMQNDLVLYSQQSEIKKKESGLLCINTPGEYEAKGAFIYGIAANGDPGGQIIYVIEIDGVRLAHLGLLKQTKFSQAQLEILEGIDVLLIPVGGDQALTAKQAAEVITELEPRVVIPMNFKTPGVKAKLDSIDLFKKEIGAKFETADKLKILKKDLPEEETRFVILETSN